MLILYVNCYEKPYIISILHLLSVATKIAYMIYNAIKEFSCISLRCASRFSAHVTLTSFFFPVIFIVVPTHVGGGAA